MRLASGPRRRAPSGARSRRSSRGGSGRPRQGAVRHDGHPASRAGRCTGSNGARPRGMPLPRRRLRIALALARLRRRCGFAPAAHRRGADQAAVYLGPGSRGQRDPPLPARTPPCPSPGMDAGLARDRRPRARRLRRSVPRLHRARVRRGSQPATIPHRPLARGHARSHLLRHGTRPHRRSGPARSTALLPAGRPVGSGTRSSPWLRRRWRNPSRSPARCCRR